MAVRRAMIDDVCEIVDLGAVMHSESVFNVFEFDRDHLLNYTAWAVGREKEFGVFVSEADAGINGVIAGFVSSHYFCPDHKIVCDFLTYVHPEARGGMAAVRLVKAYEQWAKSIGVQEISFGVSAGISDELAGRFYRGLGYKKGSVTFRKLLSDANNS